MSDISLISDFRGFPNLKNRFEELEIDTTSDVPNEAWVLLDGLLVDGFFIFVKPETKKFLSILAEVTLNVTTMGVGGVLGAVAIPAIFAGKFLESAGGKDKSKVLAPLESGLKRMEADFDTALIIPANDATEIKTKPPSSGMFGRGNFDFEIHVRGKVFFFGAEEETSFYFDVQKNNCANARACRYENFVTALIDAGFSLTGL